MTDKNLKRPNADAPDQEPNGQGAPASPNPLSRRTMAILAAICIASLLGHLALLPQMPEMVPTHWNTAGDVNGYTSRTAMIALDALPLLFLGMLYVVPNMDPRKSVYARMGSFYTGFTALFTIFLIGMTWTSELTVFGVFPATGSPVGIITSIVAGIGLVMLGNYMPKVKRNYTFGCKTPWALDNDRNWKLTHRFSGVALVMSGVAVIVSGALSMQHGEIAFWILLGSVLMTCIGTYAYSYLVFRNGNKPLRTR